MSMHWDWTEVPSPEEEGVRRVSPGYWPLGFTALQAGRLLVCYNLMTTKSPTHHEVNN
jgi:hypothetical protein